MPAHSLLRSTPGEEMSKNINVNPGQYKVAGRERPGEDVVHRDQKAALTKNREKNRTKRAAKKR
jgi:hypothetical protein